MTDSNNAGHLNVGDHNAGDHNAGDYNAGHYNAGHYNAGDRNAGSRNTGHFNTGHYNAGSSNAEHSNTGSSNAGHSNTGHCNIGHRNTGSYNTGNYNAGSYNAGDHNIGYFMTGKNTSMVPVFNNSAMVDRNEFIDALPVWIDSIGSGTEWVEAEEMTDQEKLSHADYKTTGGFLRVVSLPEAFAKAWAEDEAQDVGLVEALPGFDRDVWLEITELDLWSDAEPPCRPSEVVIDGVRYVKAKDQ